MTFFRWTPGCQQKVSWKFGDIGWTLQQKAGGRRGHCPWEAAGGKYHGRYLTSPWIQVYFTWVLPPPQDVPDFLLWQGVAAGWAGQLACQLWPGASAWRILGGFLLPIVFKLIFYLLCFTFWSWELKFISPGQPVLMVQWEHPLQEEITINVRV